MTLIQYTGKQYTLTIPYEVVEVMGWEKGTNVYVGKDPKEEQLYIVEIKNKSKRK